MPILQCKWRVGVYQCVFSVIASFDNQRLKTIYLFLHNAIWMYHPSLTYWKGTAISDPAPYNNVSK